MACLPYAARLREDLVSPTEQHPAAGMEHRADNRNASME